MTEAFLTRRVTHVLPDDVGGLSGAFKCPVVIRVVAAPAKDLGYRIAQTVTLIVEDSVHVCLFLANDDGGAGKSKLADLTIAIA